MKLTFELTDRDLDYFRKALRQARRAVRDAEEAEIIDAIREIMATIREKEPLPDFVALKLPELDRMIDMLLDEEWQLPPRERERLLATFVYFGDPEDLLADDIPVIGYLDDVIILEVVARELKHVREAYDDYCRFRDEYDGKHGATSDPVMRRDRLDRRRQQLHQRMQRRSQRDKRKSLW